MGDTSLTVGSSALVKAGSSGVPNVKECEEGQKSELIKENVEAACKAELDDKNSYHNASTLVLGEKIKKSNGSDVCQFCFAH